ncbi:hypothetical protein M0804_007964 [Polistes exclamans]|nr:hypothetical protein M0804_007964 [Polistes exclamans]
MGIEGFIVPRNFKRAFFDVILLLTTNTTTTTTTTTTTDIKPIPIPLPASTSPSAISRMEYIIKKKT